MSVRQDFRVNTQVLLVVEVSQNRVGDSSDPHLDRRAVVDEGRGIPGDALGNGASFLEKDLDEGLFVFNEVIELSDVNKAVPQGAGHPRVHLGDDNAGHLRRDLGDVHGDSQRTKSMSIRRGDMNEAQVQSPGNLVTQQPWNGGKIDGYVVPKAAVDGIACAGSQEKSLLTGSARGVGSSLPAALPETGSAQVPGRDSGAGGP